jgi:glucokinase
MYLLAADVGGTKTVFQLSRLGAREHLAEKRMQSKDFPDFSTMARTFLDGVPDEARGGIQVACLAVPGPAISGDHVLTNLPWVMDSAELERSLGIPRVLLINDFEGVAWGTMALLPEDLSILQAGTTHPNGPVLVVGAGTGLGQGVLLRAPSPQVLPSEGGHVDFAPTDPLQFALLQRLQRRYGRVSTERVLTGSGIHELYVFLAERAQEAHEHKGDKSRQVAQEVASAPDPAAVIAQHALAGDDVLCQETMELFVHIYGAHVGNAALHPIASGGVYIAGGIAPKILPLIKAGGFMQAFRRKGRMAALLAEMSVMVVQNTKVGLIGARHYAELFLEGRVQPEALPPTS